MLIQFISNTVFQEKHLTEKSLLLMKDNLGLKESKQFLVFFSSFLSLFVLGFQHFYFGREIGRIFWCQVRAQF